MKKIVILILVLIFTTGYCLAESKKPAVQPTKEELTTNLGNLRVESIIVLGKIRMLETVIDQLYKNKTELKAYRNALISEIKTTEDKVNKMK